jgi:hypothetical protein
MVRDYYPEQVALLPSASRTADPTISPSFWDATKIIGIDVVIDMTTVGTGSITVSIEGFAAGKISAPAGWYTILASAAIVTNVLTILTVHPGVTDTANSKAGRSLPKKYRVRVVHNNANPAIYSVDVNLLAA